MNKKYRIKVNFLAILLFFGCLFYPRQALAQGETGVNVIGNDTEAATEADEINNHTEMAAKEDRIGAAKKGIVEVLSGFADGNGTFRKMKSASGFLISNGENGAIIVTNAGILKSTKKEKKAYCEENDLKAEDCQFEDIVQIVIRGDVTAEAQILTQSEELDFCVLGMDSVVNEKAALRLGDSTLPVTGDTVFALGFSSDSTEIEFSEEEVEVYQGNVQDKAFSQDGEAYIQHSAAVLEGNTGGPLLDAEGYVIGINCFRYSDVDLGRYYALPVNKVAEILDNFAIAYGSREEDGLEQELETLRKECLELYQSGDYKKDSLEPLEEALAKADKLAEQEKFQPEETRQVCLELQEAKEKLIPKMEKIQKLIYVLAGLIALLCIYFLILLILNQKDKKKECFARAGRDEMPSARQCASERTEADRIQSGSHSISGKEPFQQEAMYRDKEAGRIQSGSRSISGKELFQQEVPRRDEEQEKTIGLSYYRENKTPFQKDDKAFPRRSTGLRIAQSRKGQAAEVDKPEYIIGKNPKQADFFVSDNPAVSRKHACIFWQEDAYYLSDLGSANGTYIKGEQIKEGARVSLKDGDTIFLADEEFSVAIFRRK